MGGQSLRRGQNGGQGAAKAFGVVKMAQNRPKNDPQQVQNGSTLAQNVHKRGTGPNTANNPKYSPFGPI